jgi:hypothetical protein
MCFCAIHFLLAGLATMRYDNDTLV